MESCWDKLGKEIDQKIGSITSYLLKSENQGFRKVGLDIQNDYSQI